MEVFNLNHACRLDVALSSDRPSRIKSNLVNNIENSISPAMKAIKASWLPLVKFIGFSAKRRWQSLMLADLVVQGKGYTQEAKDLANKILTFSGFEK